VRWLRLVIVVLVAAVFVAATVLLARAFTIDGAEQSAIESVLRAEARGAPAGVIAAINRCAQTPACVARARENAAALKRPGKLAVLEFNPSAGFSLGSTTGTARVAWRAGNSLPIVQCVRVHRGGNLISGFHVHLLKISKRIPSNSDCPASY
jgi:hypothetical protein